MVLIDHKGHSVVPQAVEKGFVPKEYPTHSLAIIRARILQMNHDMVFIATTIGKKHYIIGKA